MPIKKKSNAQPKKKKGKTEELELTLDSSIDQGAPNNDNQPKAQESESQLPESQDIFAPLVAAHGEQEDPQDSEEEDVPLVRTKKKAKATSPKEEEELELAAKSESDEEADVAPPKQKRGASGRSTKTSRSSQTKKESQTSSQGSKVTSQKKKESQTSSQGSKVASQKKTQSQPTKRTKPMEEVDRRGEQDEEPSSSDDNINQHMQDDHDDNDVLDQKNDKSNKTKGKSTVTFEEPSDDELDNKLRKTSQGPSTANNNRRNSIVADLQAPKAPTPRLIISHMELEDFKSYRGVQKIGPFHQCFSAIVGPNGSGKSNVIDALLFVFGFRAKALRHDTIGKLIYDQDHKKNITKCRVSVFFKEVIDHDNDEYEVVPDSEFSVSRIVKFNEVEKLLKSKQVDLVHNRFLILQGEVASISEMEPKASTKSKQGFLEYLEDIIGTSQYVEDIEKLTEEIETLETDCSSRLEKVKIAEKVKSHLEGPKQEIEKYLTKEREMIEGRNMMYQLERSKLAHKQNKLQGEAQKLQETFRQEKEQSSEIESQFQQITEQWNHAHEEKTSVEKKLNQAATEFNKLDETHSRLNSEIKRNGEKKKQLESSIQKEQKKLTSKESEIKRLQEDIKRFSKSLTDMGLKKEQEEKELENVMKSIQKKTEPFQKTLKEKEGEVVPHRDRARDIQLEIDRLNNELEVLEQPDQTSRNKLEELEKTLEQMQESVPVKHKQLEAKRKELKRQEQAFETHTHEMEDLTLKEKELNSQIQDLGLRASEAKSSTTEQTGQSKLLKSVMDAAKRGELKGVRGKLGDLGTIPAAFDVAVSTAAPSLNFIVVDTTENAQSCVSFLKKHNLGVMTFCILDKIQYLDKVANKPFKAPENSQRLFDLIKPDHPDYRVAFYYAMHDTLVTKDLDTASKIAYTSNPPRRVVTEVGQLIESSGAMSGGGTRVLSGFMRTLEKTRTSESAMSPKEIEALENKVKRLEIDLTQLRQAKQKLADTIDEVQLRVDGLRLEVKKLEVDHENLQKQAKQLQQRIPELKEKISKGVQDVEEITRNQKEIETKKKELQSVEKLIEKVEKQVNEIKEQIMQAGGTKLKDQKQKVDDLAKQIEEYENARADSKAQVLSNENAVEKAKSAVESARKELHKLGEATSKAEQQRQETEDNAFKVEEQKKKLQEELSEKEKQFKKLETKRSEIKKTFDKMKNSHLDLQHKIEDKEKELNGVRKLVTQKTKQIQDLPNKITVVEESDPVPELETFEDEKLEEFNLEDLQLKVGRIEQELGSQKININLLKEYREKEQEWKNKVSDLEQSRKTRDDVLNKCDALKKKRFNEFMDGFTEITFKLKEMYQMITLGGDADLELVDRLDPFSEGIRFHVRPKDKSWKQITHLSGGEKTLASLSLIFALHYYKPNPLYVMDEIDAALDFKNVSIIANYIKERTQNAQFIVITLRNYMFELSDNLVGIFKTDNKSRSVTINPHHFAQPSSQQPRPASQSQRPLRPSKLKESQKAF